VTGTYAESGSVSPPTFLERERHMVEAALEDVGHRAAEMLAGDIRKAVQYALATSGKRIRPILCVAAYSAARRGTEPPIAAYRLSCALELVHIYSLVHDDLPCMDNDDLRRGRPTVHRVFGNGVATLAGAAFLPLAVQVVDVEGETLGLAPEHRGRLVVQLTEAAGATGMVGGQLMDLLAEGRPIEEQELESIQRRKTAALLAASLRLGAMAGDATAELLAALTRYGLALGLAFQIADDLLDVEGTADAMGKVTGRDVALEKASYPSLVGIHAARALARARADEAKAALQGFDLPELEQLADYVVQRRR
jgi:geranylgeranyl diphosphate synthase, type II